MEELQAPDPFALDQSAMEEKLQALQRSFERWRALRSACAGDVGGYDRGNLTESDTVPADMLQDELKWLTDEIIRSLKSLTWELNDLHETLRAMLQRQPAATAGATDNRRLFISNARALLSAIEAEVRQLPPDRQQPATTFGSVQSEATASHEAVADVELLLGTESNSGPRPQAEAVWDRLPGPIRRLRGPLICLALLLGAAFLAWVFYEAALSGQRRDCVCSTVSGQTVSTAGTAGGSSTDASVPSSAGFDLTSSPASND